MATMPGRTPRVSQDDEIGSGQLPGQSGGSGIQYGGTMKSPSVAPTTTRQAYTGAPLSREARTSAYTRALKRF